MIGTQLGEYVVVARLGAGAMGTVYLGERADGSRAALKVLHPHLVEEPGHFRRFEREAAVGLSVNEEHVVSVLDYEMLFVDESPLCVVVTEYVEGKTLRELLNELGQVPEALLREIASQIARGLQAIHAQGIVHRDIKPENIMITDEQRVRIMDLGVAKVPDASLELTHEGGFAGTLSYAAPEQLSGQAVTPSADLYALGVLLYELATGDNPFRHEDAAATIAAHMNDHAARASERTEGVSPFFSELLVTLLAKAPEERVDSAARLSELLANGERSAWWLEREAEATRTIAIDTLVPVRRETRLQGRESELATLQEALEAARQGEGGMVLITGEAGLGKSRLLDAFLQAQREKNLRVLYGSYSQSGGEDAIGSAVIGALGRAHLDASVRARIPQCPGLAPAIAAGLLHEALPDGSEPLGVDVLHTVFCRLAQGLAGEKTTIWIVEDIHFASKDAQKLLLSLARAALGHRLLIIGTTRPARPDKEYVSFDGVRGLRTLTIGKLSPREVIQLLRDAFRSERLADKLGAEIAYKSDGVPFFVFEMIRGLKEGQFITELQDGSWVESTMIDDIEVPPAIDELIAARLKGLSDDDRALLDFGAVNGDQLDSSLVARGLGLPRLQVLQRLAAIERRYGLIRSEDEQLRFDHNLVRQALYDGIPSPLRSEYHLSIAEALESRTAAAETDPSAFEVGVGVRVCEHFLRSRTPERAVGYLEAALDHLTREYQHGRKLALAESALGKPGLLEDSARLAVLIAKSEGLDSLGRRDEQEDVLREAREMAEELADKASIARTLLALGMLFENTSRLEEALPHFERALSIYREFGDRHGEGHALGGMGRVSRLMGRAEEARALAEQQISIAADPNIEAQARIALGNANQVLGRYETAMEQYEQAAAVSHEHGLPRAEGVALGGMAFNLWRRGLYDEAVERYQAASQILRRVGYRLEEANNAGLLGVCLHSQERYAEARRHYEMHLAYAHELGDLRGEADTLANLGTLFKGQGRYADARALFTRSKSLAAEIGFRRGEAQTGLGHSDLLLALGLRSEAMASCKHSLEISRETRDRQVEAEALLCLGVIAYEQGESAESWGLTSQVLELARELGESGTVAQALLHMGRTGQLSGKSNEADHAAQEAAAMFREQGRRTLLADTLAVLADLHGGDVHIAESALDELEEDSDALGARFHLWKATGKPEHLAEAKRLLDYRVEHAPEECRESMLRNVRLNRKIMEAWDANQ